MKWPISSKEKWFELTFALKIVSNTLIHCLWRYGEMLFPGYQWEVLINTSFLQENLVIQKEIIRQYVSRIWLFLITRGHLPGPGHHHLLSAFLQKLPDGPLCFILTLQSKLKKQLDHTAPSATPSNDFESHQEKALLYTDMACPPISYPNFVTLHL